MSNTCGGFNPLRYDCEKQGCFNQERRPKIEFFSDCFPGNINFGDVDAEVEMNGYGLRLEWKSQACEIKKGQAIMFEHKTRYSIDTVICVIGDPKHMTVEQVGFYWLGKWRGWEHCDLDGLKTRIKGWVEWVQSIPRLTTIAGIIRCVLRQYALRDVLHCVSLEVGEIEKKQGQIKRQARAA